MKREIRFKKIHTLRIDGKEKRFMVDDTVEVEENEGKELIRLGVAVPGLQEGQAINMNK
jgi:hypothetical protein